MSFLNTVPLVWGMLHGEQRGVFDLSFAIPAECADRLADGRADIGIVPAVELNRQRLNIIRGAGIASRGPVRSILLISKVPFDQIRTLATDSSSRTSVALSRIILARKYAVQPQVISLPPDLDRMLSQCDAALVIGDPALVIDPARQPQRTLDLGAEWTSMTGLPMVFAVWAARPDAPGQHPEPFSASLRYGLDHLEDIVREYHSRVGVSADLARKYLTSHIVFELGEREYAGLDRFLQYAAELETRKELSKASV